MVSDPWLIAGQLLAMERWMHDFQPSLDPINATVVWLRLPNLLLMQWWCGCG